MDLTFKRCSGLKWNFACFDHKGNFSKCQSFIIFLSLLISSNARNPQTVMWVVIFFSFSSRLYAFYIRRTWFFFFLPLISNINLSDHNAQTLQPTLSQRVLPFTLPFSCMSIRCKNLLLGFKIMCKSSSWAFCSSLETLVIQMTWVHSHDGYPKESFMFDVSEESGWGDDDLTSVSAQFRIVEMSFTRCYNSSSPNTCSSSTEHLIGSTVFWSCGVT